MSTWRRRATLGGLAVGVAVVAVLAATSPVDVARLRALARSPWFPVALVGLYLVRPVLAWPITLLSVLVGFRYGVAVGVPVALAGAVVTSLIPFVAAGRFRPEDGVLGRVTRTTREFFRTTGDVRGVVAARLAPTPAEAVSAAAGLAGVSLPAFVVGTAVGELPWTVAAVVAGSSMHRLTLAGAAVDPWVAAAGAIGALALLAGPAVRYARQKGSLQS